MATFSAANHPKAGGIDFSLSYPSNWTAREGKRPHIVQMFVSPDPGEFFNVSVYDLENSDQSTYDAVVSKEGIKSLLPEGAEMISHSVTKLDGEVCGMVESSSSPPSLPNWAASYLPPRELYDTGIYQESIAIVAAGSLEQLIESIAKRISVS